MFLQEFGNIESSTEYFLKYRIKNCANILDIGCAYGSLLNNLYNNGYKNLYGIDVNSGYINKGKRMYPHLSKNMCLYDGKEIPYQDRFFDVVLMFDVIEHIPEIDDYIKEQVYRVLKKGGVFIFQTPNKYINIPWEVIHQRSLSAWMSYHISLQTKDSLVNMLKNVGFSNVNVEKHTISTEHNKRKLRSRIGVLGDLLLIVFQSMPITFYPNLWGFAKKK